MKAGDVFVVDSPGDEQIHGRKFRLIAEEKLPEFQAGPRPLWLSEDVVTGERRHWRREHFGTALKPAT